MDSGKLAANFLFLDIEKASDMLDHLFVGESHIIASRAIWGRRGHSVRGVAATIDGGRRTRRNKDGGG